MAITVRDDEMLKALSGTIEPLEFRAPDGRLLGEFIPARRPGLSFPEFGLTDAELDRQLSDPNTKWHTPEEVMARLREIDRCSP